MSGKLKLIIVLFCLIAAPINAQAGPILTLPGVRTGQLKAMCTGSPAQRETCKTYLLGAFEALNVIAWICATGRETPEDLRTLFLAGTDSVGAKADQEPASTMVLYAFTPARPCQKRQ
jgi:hypothetical protein